MLKFTLDQQGNVVVKQSEIFKIENLTIDGVISFKHLTRDTIEDIYIIKDSNTTGTHLIPEFPGSVGDFVYLDTKTISLLQTSQKFNDLENFYIVFTSKESFGQDQYLFEEDSSGRNIVNSTIGDDFVTLVQRVYILQEEYNYRRVIISQIDLSPHYGLKPDFFKFQYSSEDINIDIDSLEWYDTLSFENIEKNESTNFFIKLLLPKTGLTTINRDIQIHYTAYEY